METEDKILTLQEALQHLADAKTLLMDIPEDDSILSEEITSVYWEIFYAHGSLDKVLRAMQ